MNLATRLARRRTELMFQVVIVRRMRLVSVSVWRQYVAAGAIKQESGPRSTQGAKATGGLLPARYINFSSRRIRDASVPPAGGDRRRRVRRPGSCHGVGARAGRRGGDRP